MNTQQLPPFTPIGATPVSLDHEAPKAKRVTKAKPNGVTVAKGPKKSRPAKYTYDAEGKVTGLAKTTTRKQLRKDAQKAGTVLPAKRARSTRVAPLMMDAAQALAVLNGLGAKEIAAIQQMVMLLNPLPRPGRQRAMAAVAALVFDKNAAVAAVMSGK